MKNIDVLQNFFPDQTPTLISAKGCENLEHILSLDNHIYIGRHNKHVGGTFDSKWRNPYYISKYGRSKCIEKFKIYLARNEDLLSDIKDLYGKTLVCWCVPNACHGEILIDLCK